MSDRYFDVTKPSSWDILSYLDSSCKPGYLPNKFFQKHLNRWHGSLVRLESGNDAQKKDIAASLLLRLIQTVFFIISSLTNIFPTVHRQTICLSDVQPVLGHRQTICLSVFKLYACGASTGPTRSQINYMLICSLSWWDCGLELLLICVYRVQIQTVVEPEPGTITRTEPGSDLVARP